MIDAVDLADRGVLAGHRAFRVALEALARPGRRARIAGAASARAAAEQVVLALFEPGTRTWRLGLWSPELVATAPEDAQLLLVAAMSSEGALLRAPRGSEEYPEHGATAVYAPEVCDARLPVRLSGPGIDGDLTTTLPLERGEVEARNAACARAPLGVDILVIERDGAVLGLPRSTRVEVRG